MGSHPGKLIELSGSQCVLGRGEQVDVCLDTEGVSRRHAELVQYVDGSFVVIDLDSTNGTFVNGRKIAREALVDGDRIALGANALLKFTLHDPLEAKVQTELYESATFDALTQTYNRRYFVDRIQEEFSFATRKHTALSLVVLDVDHFKHINDSKGHPAGDYVLTTLAATIASRLRPEDALCRIGGEEFAVILRATELRDACTLAERVRVGVADTEFVYEGERIAVTISLGVATYHLGDFEDHDVLVAEADKWLYIAKQSGRNRVAAATAG